MSAAQTTARQGDTLVELVGDIERLEGIFAEWDPSQREAVDAYRRAIEALHGEALKRLVRQLKLDAAALAAMKAALGDEVVYSVLRRLQIVKASLAERIEVALESVRPMLASHGGDVELVKLQPPAIEVRFLGACDGCPSSMMTFHEGVKKAVEAACPEITEIRQARGGLQGPHAVAREALVSPFALNRQGGWRFACALSAIPDGGLLALALDGEKLLLARRDARVTCFQNACAHLGLTLDEGEVADGVLICPHHGFQYDLATGECLTAATVQLAAYAVRLDGEGEGARVEVRLAR